MSSEDFSKRYRYPAEACHWCGERPASILGDDGVVKKWRVCLTCLVKDVMGSQELITARLLVSGELVDLVKLRRAMEVKQS